MNYRHDLGVKLISYADFLEAAMARDFDDVTLLRYEPAAMELDRALVEKLRETAKAALERNP